MEKSEIQRIASLQRSFFRTGRTKDINYRINALKTLGRAIELFETDIYDALKKDLGKSETESLMCEVGLVKSEISYMIKHVRHFAAKRHAKTPIAQFSSSSYMRAVPLGDVLIMSPWNYPFMLTFDPLVDAIAAGNTAMVKPSAYAPATGAVMKKIIETVFPERYVAVVTGGRAENTYLLDEKFDMIFFTGSKTVGRLAMKKASEHLCPVVLELGGKSPCIVDRTADIELAARRIVWGKYLNCGQTCVAPDYIFCDSAVKDDLKEALISEIRLQFGDDVLNNDDYGNIINEKHFNRICGLIPDDSTDWDAPDGSGHRVYGGKSDSETLKIEPTVIDDVTPDDAVMGEEIFGPLLPIMTYDDMDDAINYINDNDRPLAMYVFTNDKDVAKKFMSSCTFGGGCINDTVIHIATTEMPFGGAGESGMGMYHGKFGFDAFSHITSIVDKKTWLDLPLRYQPFRDSYTKVLRKVMR